MIHTIVEPPADYYYQDDLQQQSQVLSPAPVPTALEKTRMCVYYLQGRCKYDDCSFAHSAIELKQAPSNLRKTKMCDLFMMGHCYDSQCNFAHSVDELKVRPKRAMSTSLSPSLAGASLTSQADQQEFCARTILSMLVKMQPEAAVSFLSNPECKSMLERLLEDETEGALSHNLATPSGGSLTPPPSSSASSSYLLGSTVDSAVTPPPSPVSSSYFPFDLKPSNRF